MTKESEFSSVELESQSVDACLELFESEHFAFATVDIFAEPQR